MGNYWTDRAQELLKDGEKINRIGRLIEAALRNQFPERFQEFQAKGMLQAFLLVEQHDAAETMEDLVRQKVPPLQAESQAIQESLEGLESPKADLPPPQAQENEDQLTEELYGPAMDLYLQSQP